MFEDVGADEYERRKDARRDDDFIVDDEGFGYKDNGGEIWENQSDEDGDNKKRGGKRKLAKDEQTIN